MEGIAETIRAIKDFEPDIYKKMGGAIRKFLRILRDAARTRRPEGVYTVSTRLTDKRGPMGSVTSGVPGMSVDEYLALKTSWSAAQRSVIFEFAEKGQRPGMKAAIESFNRRYGKPGRFLWGAYDYWDLGEWVESQVEAEIREAEAEFQRRLDSGV